MQRDTILEKKLIEQIFNYKPLDNYRDKICWQTTKNTFSSVQ